MLLIQEQRFWIPAKGGICQAAFLVNGSGRNGFVLCRERRNSGPEPIYDALLLSLGMAMESRELLFRVRGTWSSSLFTFPHQR